LPRRSSALPPVTEFLDLVHFPAQQARNRIIPSPTRHDRPHGIAPDRIAK